MPWPETVDEISKRMSPLIEAAERYALEIKDLHSQALESGAHSGKTLKVWQWQLDAANSFLEQAEELHADLMRMAEQDYVLRRPDADEILI